MNPQQPLTLHYLLPTYPTKVSLVSSHESHVSFLQSSISLSPPSSRKQPQKKGGGGESFLRRLPHRRKKREPPPPSPPPANPLFIRRSQKEGRGRKRKEEEREEILCSSLPSPLSWLPQCLIFSRLLFLLLLFSVCATAPISPNGGGSFHEPSAQRTET